jgi:Putative zinc-finger
MTNCEWFDSKLEAYFCDELAGDELRNFQAHLASCAECRREVESLNRIDPIVTGVMQHRLAIAQMSAHRNGRPRVLRLAVCASSVAAVIVLLVIGTTRFTQQAPAPAVAVQPSAIHNPIEPTEIKKSPTQEPTVRLGKPGDAPPAQPAPQPHLDDPLVNGPEFAITDAAGYTANLETYRGRVLLFGVVSPDQKAAVSNLEQIYEAFGSNGRVGIVPIARHRDDEFRGAKFPVFFNNGSKLLGVGEGEFKLLDATGKLRLEGSLADPASVARIKSEMGQLGIR